MPRMVSRKWVSTAVSHTGKSMGVSCDYEAYVPDPLTGRRFTFTGEPLSTSGALQVWPAALGHDRPLAA